MTPSTLGTPFLRIFLLLLLAITTLFTSSIHALPGTSPSLASRSHPRPITVRHYTLNVTTSTLFSACDPFGPTTVINSTLPGPTLRARAGEILRVRVYNNLDSSTNLTLHFHGLSMKMHPVMDGTMLLSQWPIVPGEFFDYTIPLTAEDKGTYFHHSHVGVQAMTAYGALVVEDPEDEEFVDPSGYTVEMEKGESVRFRHVWGEEGLNEKGKSGRHSPYRYDEDRVLAVGDWFSYSSIDLITRQLKGDPFVWPGSATKLMMNGKSSPSDPFAEMRPSCNQTKADVTGISCDAAPRDCGKVEYPTIHVDFKKTYRLRFIGATALMYTSLGILKPTKKAYSSVNATSAYAAQKVRWDKMKVIEADGSYLDALEVDHIEFTAGQRYSVLWKSRSRSEVEKDGVGGVYWMRVESRWRAGPSMWVKIVYPTSSTTAPTAIPPVKLFAGHKDLQLLPPESFGWKASSLSPLSLPSGPQWWYAERMPSDSEVTRTVVIDTQQVKFYPSSKGVKWDMNGVPFNESSPGTTTPYLVRTFLGDTPFPSSSQLHSAMLNPTNYSHANSDGTTTGNERIIDLSNSTESSAASSRDWNQSYSSSLNMFFAQHNEIIDVVLINKPSLLSSSVEIHPWHMHSHKHFTRTIQPGTFSFSRLSSLYSSSHPKGFAHPISRDTTVAYASPGAAFANQTISNPTTEDGGWTVLRYKVDAKNAGVFLLHCHLHFHLEMGMATVWAIAPEVLAQKNGIYWPTKNGLRGENVQGLDGGYLQFGKSVEAVM
ncbi:putative multicopper ferro-O2-oxidoreductase [Pseudozyma hubeiensis]|nr:putative multicopper ferro-O2-oxidoreductase [Pseudozyma hubeiensis]